MKELIINSRHETVPESVVTIEDLLKYLNIKPGGTGVARNHRIILSRNWNVTKLENGDNVTIISAAYGG